MLFLQATKMRKAKIPEEEDKELASAKITCIYCDRHRKKSLCRSDMFCTRHCQLRWQEELKSSQVGRLCLQICLVLIMRTCLMMVSMRRSV